jgi:hypothetical protein
MTETVDGLPVLERQLDHYPPALVDRPHRIGRLPRGGQSRSHGIHAELQR